MTSSANLRSIGLGSGDGGTATRTVRTVSGTVNDAGLTTTTSFAAATTATNSRTRTTTGVSVSSSLTSYDDNNDKVEYPTTWYRWLILAIFAFVASGNGMAFMAYGAAEAEFASYYDGECLYHGPGVSPRPSQLVNTHHRPTSPLLSVPFRWSSPSLALFLTTNNNKQA